MQITSFAPSGYGKTYSDLRKKVRIDEFVFAHVLYRYNKETDSYDRAFKLTKEEERKWLR